MRHIPALSFFLLASHFLLASPAEARPVTCWTSDRGSYGCDFRQHGGNGSFTVVAPGRIYTLVIFARGVGDLYTTIDGRDIPLAGPFVRSHERPACWISDATGFTLCAQ